jgi:hypothetical protein
MYRRFRPALTAAALCLLLAVASVSVAAQTTLSSPSVPVAPGTTSTFVGAGFQPGEPVSLWMTAPDTSVTPLDGVTADTQGAISATVFFPTAGSWNVTAHGQTSGIQVVENFAVGATDTSQTTGTTLGALPALPLQGGASTLAPSSTTFPQVAIGAPVLVTGSGLLANEPLAFWQTAPDSTVAPLQGPQTADPNGAFSLSIPFTTPGFWQVTAHGITSGHEVIGRYVVTGDGSIPSAALPGSVAAPAGTNASVTSVGASISFTGSGFNAGERISSWVTGPDGSVTALPQANADSNGTATVTTSFPTAGAWQITLHGVDSGREVIGQYQVAG